MSDDVIFYKNLLLAKDLSFAYVQVPKAACSTVKQFLSPVFVSDPMEKQRRIHQNFNWIGYDNSGFFRNLSNISENVPLLTVVRNPYSRILSAYLDKIVSLKEGYIYREELGIKSKGDIEFGYFLDALRAHPFAALNGHFQPQALIAPVDKIRFSIIGCVEDFYQFVLQCQLQIMETGVVNVERQAPHSTKANHDDRFQHYYYDPLIVSKVQELYCDDFTLFQYQLDPKKYASSTNIITHTSVCKNNMQEYTKRAYVPKIDHVLRSYLGGPWKSERH